MGLGRPTGGGGGTGLTTHQSNKLGALSLPDLYDDNRSVCAHRIPGVPAECVLALKVHDGSVTDVSSPAHTVSLNGNAAASTAKNWAGDSSLAMDGTGDYAEIDQSTDFDLGSGDFDIRCAVYMTEGLPNEEDLICKWGDTAGTCSWAFSLRANGSAQTLEFMYSTTGNNSAPTQRTIDIDDFIAYEQWHHYRVTRSGSVLSLYVDEKVVYTVAIADTLYTANTPVHIGSRSAGYGDLAGYIDNVYVQKAGTIEGSDFKVSRHLLSSSDQDVLQPEKPECPVSFTAFGPTTDIVAHASDPVFTYRVPAKLNGLRIDEVSGRHDVVGSGGTATNIEIKINGTDALSTDLSIDSGELNSSTATTAAVVDPTANLLATGDIISVLVTTADSTTVPQGLEVPIILR